MVMLEIVIQLASLALCQAAKNGVRRLISTIKRNYVMPLTSRMDVRLKLMVLVLRLASHIDVGSEQ